MTDQLIGSSGALRIGAGTQVKLHFAILLAGGEEVDSTRRGKPATFVVGDGNLLPGFERALFGLKAGDDEQLRIPAADGFGERNPGNVRVLPRRDFPDADALEVGLMLSFAAPDGELPGVITRIWEETVEMDFNHPLAGRDLIFDVSILSVEPAPA
ncbi:MAG: peptidylprolyl isomerase [Pseudomonadota bacterium]